MVRFFIRSASPTACLLLSACFLISDDEIATRIKNALPATIAIEINDIEKTLTCIAATFTVLEPFDRSEIIAANNISTESGLGKSWHLNTSFSGYVETIQHGTRKFTVEGTIVHARPCMESVGFETNLLYNRTVTVTRSISGKELLIIFDQSASQFGIYLAQGG